MWLSPLWEKGVRIRVLIPQKLWPGTQQKNMGALSGGSDWKLGNMFWNSLGDRRPDQDLVTINLWSRTY